MKKILVMIFVLLAIACNGQEYVNCANACKISGLQMKECTTSDEVWHKKSCKCGEPLK